MNIEQFPTNETALRMLEMVSPIYEQSYVGKWLYQVMGAEVEKASNIVLALLNEAFPETATFSIPYWEELYGISSNESLSIEERRKRIIVKRSFRAPMNPARIELLIKEACGRDVKLIENIAPSVFGLEIQDGKDGVNIESIISLVNEVKQAQKSVRIFVEQHSEIPVFYGLNHIMTPKVIIQCEKLNYYHMRNLVGIKHVMNKKIIIQ